jgi:predicted Zn-dependent protease
VKENTIRAERRHHVERLKNNRSGYYGRNNFVIGSQAWLIHRGMLANTATLCSCWKCGNGRRYFKHRTLHEVSHDNFSKVSDD